MTTVRRLFPAILAIASLTACKGQNKGGAPGAAPTKGGPPPPTEVGVVTVEPQSVTLTRELPGRTSAFRTAEVRARVNGIVLKRLFTEGSDVKEGQPLFRIDSAPYEATLESARATLARAEAAVTTRRLSAQRYGELIGSNAVSKQEHDDAIAALKAAEADVAAGRAAVRSATINVDYSTVNAPIAGRIGRAVVTEGAYVQASTATLMATIQQLDPLYVDLTWSSTALARLKRDLEAGKIQAANGQAEVKIVLEDGREYGEPGKLQFADAQVDPSTGSITLRAIVPNPKGELLPGLFVRARLAEGQSPNAILVPQRGITRDATGRATAMVVNAEKKVERRQLVTDRAIGDAWLVTEGLKVGDQVIVEGLQKVRPGAVVTPVPADKKQATR